MTNQLCHALILLWLCAAAACERPPSGSAPKSSGPPTIYTVNYPLMYFAQRIAGDHVRVVFPGPGDADPACWIPDAGTVIAFQGADLVLLNGAGYAGWAPQVSLPLAKLVDCGASQKDRFITMDSSLPHTHGPSGDHSHGELAFTLWLDPKRATRQAEVIQAALVKRWPEHEAAFDEGMAELRTDLETLDRELADAATALGKQAVVFSHPVYQYFQERFDLDGESLHWEPDADPGEKGWAELDRLLADHPAKLMIWEGEPLPEVVTKLEAMGIRSVVFNPCATPPATGDYLSVMRANAEALRKVSSAGPAPAE